MWRFYETLIFMMCVYIRKKRPEILFGPVLKTEGRQETHSNCSANCSFTTEEFVQPKQ